MAEKNYGLSYNAAYYLDGCGQNYNDREYWAPVFRNIAERLVDQYRPRTFLDVGCAYGYLVEAMRDLGVEAYGVDVSEFAISRVREDVRPYCRVCDASKGLPGDIPQRYDCVSSIEVVEHLYEEDAQPFLHALCSASDCVVFSSTPDDFTEKTHRNVQQREYWVKRFAQEGFLHDLGVDLSYLAPQALAFRRMEKEPLKLIEDYEHAARLAEAKARAELDAVIANKDSYISGLQKHIDGLQEVGQRAAEEVQKVREDAELERRREREQAQIYVRELLRSSGEDSRAAQAKVAQAEAEAAQLRAETAAYAAMLQAAREHEQQLQSVHDQIVNSTFWKLTWPGRRAVSQIRKMLGRGTPAAPAAPAPAPLMPAPAVCAQDSALSAGTYWMRLNRNTQPIPTAIAKTPVRRLNLVTDSLSRGSLMGGVATTILIAAEFACRNDMPLRVITRDAPANPQDFLAILTLNGMEPPKEIEYYCDSDRDADGQKATRLPVTEEDVFMATSWWSAMAVEHTSLRRRFYYVIQEVETYFYPYGDLRLLCSSVMKNPNIDFIVNSHYLWEYFRENEPNIVEHGIYFEPAFSKTLYLTPDFAPKARRRLFFYSRPNNPRNLFAFGLRVLDEAIARGILDTEEWEICFAGQDVPDVRFCDGSKPVNCGLMTWEEYREFTGTIDLALSLMYTPHPSYPPFDIAVSGGVVVTNCYRNKTEFPGCRNVLMGELELESMMETMQRGVKLACSDEERARNYAEMTIPRNWPDTLKETLEKMGECL